MLKIVSYNLLADPLASPASFGNYHPKVLSASRRWKLTMNLMKTFVEELDIDILCLQEVTKTRWSTLSDFFDEHGYRSFFVIQGRPFNDYMGIMVAVKNSLKPHSPEFLRLSDLMAQKYELDEYHIKEILTTYENFTLSQAREFAGAWYEKVRGNFNWLIRLHITHQDHDVVVVNTHLPCRFEDQRAMILYARTAVSTIREYPRAILAGDFNINSEEVAYYSLVSELTSAHVLATEKEPEYTNVSETVFRDGPPNYFKGTIDYVLTRGFTKSTVLLPLPTDGKKLPSETHPSDHVALCYGLEVE